MKNKNINKVNQMVTLLIVVCLLTRFVLAFTPGAKADLSFQESLKEKAQNYVKEKDYSNAEQVYNTIIANWPNSDLAFEAQQKLIKLYITTNSNKAPQAISKFLAAHVYYHPENWTALQEIISHNSKQQDFNSITVYQNAFNKNASEPNMAWAQSYLAIYYLQQNKNIKAEAIIKTLVADNFSYADVPGSISLIADYYLTRKTDRAIELYHYILSKHPSDFYAMSAQAGLARCYILQNDDAQADAAIKKLLSDYTGHPDIVVGIGRVANQCLSKRPEKAIELYRHILTDYASDSWAMNAQAGLARCYILQNDDAQADAAIKKLLSDYTGHPDIVVGIGRVANQYLSKKPEKAIELYRHILTDYASDSWAINAQAGLARCYILQNDDAQADAAIKKLLGDFLGYPNFSNVFNMIARQLRQQNKMSLIDQSYIMDNWINGEKTLDISKTGVLFCIEYLDNKTALDVLDKFIVNLPKDTNSQNILNQLADRCHELKKHELAVKLYQTYLDHLTSGLAKEEIVLNLYKSMYLADMDLEKILMSLDEYINRNKKANATLAVKALILKGQTFAKLGEINKAIDQFLIIKIEYPDVKESPEASFFVGYCYMLQGKFEQAKEALNLVVKDYPQSSFASEARLCLTRIETMTEK